MFSNPLKVSTLFIQDSLFLRILEPSSIKSLRGLELSESNYKLKIPRQLPPGVEIDSIIETAVSVIGTYTAFTIVKMIIMLILKKNMHRIKSAFLETQAMAFLLMIQVMYPANVQIFMKEIMQFVRFELIQVKNLAKIFIT